MSLAESRAKAIADWLSSGIKATDNGGTSITCPVTQESGRRPRKLRKRKEPKKNFGSDKSETLKLKPQS